MLHQWDHQRRVWDWWRPLSLESNAALHTCDCVLQVSQMTPKHNSGDDGVGHNSVDDSVGPVYGRASQAPEWTIHEG